MQLGETGRKFAAETSAYYRVIKEELKSLTDHNILVQKSNLAHKDSRVLCTSVLQHDWKITKNCKESINDCVNAAVDEFGDLVKTKEQGRQFLITYGTPGTYYPDFITNPNKYRYAA